MLLIYTGNGKGKTSACVGQCIRAYGQGFNVLFVQLMKSDQNTGEQRFLKELLQDKIYIGGKGFFRKEEERPIHRLAVETSLEWIKNRLESTDMLIIDECLYAYKAELITQAEIEELIELCQDKHLVLSGRGAPDWLIERADTVSEIMEVKHACQKGVPAQKGIEF